jgi:translation elongation factor EF-1alpha
MDDESVNWSQEHYNTVVAATSKFLGKIGYDTGMASFIPLSGYNGDNLVQKSPNTPWYLGPSLAEALDSLAAPQDRAEMPLRLPVRDFFFIPGIIFFYHALKSFVLFSFCYIEAIIQELARLFVVRSHKELLIWG